MKLSTIAGAAALGLPGAAPSGETKPSVPFDSVLSEVASEGSANSADAPSAEGLRAGSAPLSPFASSDPDTTPGGSDAGAFRQRPDFLDQDGISAAAGPALEDTRSRESVSTAAADVFQLATRAAEPIRHAPLGLQPSPQVAKAALGASVQALVEKPGAAALAQARYHVLHAPAASGQGVSVADPLSSSTVDEAEQGVLDAGLASPTTRNAARGSTNDAEARRAAAAPDPAALGGAMPAAAAMQGLVAAVFVPTAIAAPTETALSHIPVRGIDVPGEGSLGVGSPDLRLPVDGDVASPSAGTHRSTALPAADESSAYDPLVGETAADQPALAAVVSVVGQIVPGTVEVESHLGFVPAPDAGRLPPNAGATPSGASEPEPEAAASAPATMQPAAVAAPAAGGAPSGAFGFADGTHASWSLRSDGALRSKASAADDHAKASIRGPDDVTSPGDAVAATDVHSDGGYGPTAPGRVSTSLPPIIAAPDAARTDRPLDPTAIASVAPILQPASQTTIPLARQIADGVAGLAAAAVPDADARTPQVAAARTMILQLSPAGLGTLSVRLHVAGRALDVRLEASDGRTTALIDRDRDVLADALRSKDYQLQTLSVTTHETTMGGGSHAERGTDPGSSRSSQPNQDEGSRGGQGRRDDRGAGERPRSRPQEKAVVDRAGAALFV